MKNNQYHFIRLGIAMILIEIAICLGFLLCTDRVMVKDKRNTLFRQLAYHHNAKEEYLNMYREKLYHSHFNDQEKAYLARNFTLFLDRYYHQLSYDYLANILWTTENVNIHRDITSTNSSTKGYLISSSNNILLTPDTIKVNDSNLKVLYHEYIHAGRSWIDNNQLNQEIFAAILSNNGYEDIVAIMTMLGDIGRSEVLFANLINNNLNNYYQYLKELYPGLEPTIDSLQTQIATLFNTTYNTEEINWLNRTQLCIEIKDNIDVLYSQKYQKKSSEDKLYTVLTDIMLGNDNYKLETNIMLNNNQEYYFYDFGEEVQFHINRHNRFNNV